MNTGQIISGAGHASLIAWAVLGGSFNSEPLPFEITEVTAISAEDYAALTAAQTSPEAAANVDTPEPPQAGDAPSLSSEADSAPAQADPEVSQAQPPDEAPQVVEPVPVPPAEVSDAPAEPPTPQEDLAVLAPEVSSRPQAREAPRVAPEPVAPPPPDVRIDDMERQESTPDPEADTSVPDEEATAPEEATTEIVTEAERAEAAAPSRSLRPRPRPALPESADAPTATAQPAQDDPATDDSAVADALAEALEQAGATGQTGTPQGPPLTAGERDGLRVAVQQCWNVGSLSSDALRTTVVVGVSLNRDGTLAGDVRQISAQGGSGGAARQAFEAARRAILRCGASGFDLPAEKYDHWREIEMSFNPKDMRIK